MIILAWVLSGIICSLCCIWITGFRLGKGMGQYLEFCLIGCLGGILASVLMQDVIIGFSLVFGPVFRIVGLFFDGALISLLLYVALTSLFIRYLRPAKRKHILAQSVLIVLVVCLFVCAAALLSFMLRAPIEAAYLVINRLNMTNLDVNFLLVNFLAPMAGGWALMLLFVSSFLFRGSDIVLAPAPVSSLLPGIPKLFFRRRKTKESHVYLLCGDHQAPVTSLTWSADDRQLVSTSSIHLCISDVRTGQTIFSQDPITFPSAVVWSGDELRLASASQGINLATVKDKAFSTNTLAISDLHNVSELSWSPNGRFLALVEGEHTIQICNALTGERAVYYDKHTAPVQALAWSPDGAMIASGDAENTIHIWESVTGKAIVICKGHTDAIRALSWSPDGNLLASGSSDKTLRIWNAKAGNQLRAYTGHSGVIGAVSWSPDGSLLASGSDDKIVRVWSASEEKLRLLHTGHANTIEAIQWSHNGALIASGSADGSVHIWMVPGR